ncbi:MAG: tRNA uridine-5-carboxymethylaminomethyl(34) synthesis GTPase MnmE, partial [Bacteroides sp.]|nr:tRNA uridine-5-carboxymethylaminomethyl(34) synthesis GTPase MnmE [Bacteroides sp.]
MRELGIFTDGTICAPATIPGTGAISIIRVCGEDSLAIADKVIDVKGESLSETEGYRLRYGTIFADDGSVLDNVIVSVFRAPHSYTGENSVEISCHASRFIVNEVLELLVNAGARIAAPGEFTRRAFVNGKMDLAQAEAVADVIASQSAAAHRVAMNQLKGGFSSELKTLREKLLTMTSLLELELDFSEEDVEFASRSELGSLVEETLTHIVRLTDSFSRGNAIKNGVPVAIVGATNTGKSTLLNALLGEERAIVSDIAGTTRDTIEETLNLGGVMFRFIDTAGIRETDELVEKIGIERTFKKLNEASIV